MYFVNGYFGDGSHYAENFENREDALRFVKARGAKGEYFALYDNGVKVFTTFQTVIFHTAESGNWMCLGTSYDGFTVATNLNVCEGHVAVWYLDVPDENGNPQDPFCEWVDVDHVYVDGVNMGEGYSDSQEYYFNLETHSWEPMFGEDLLPEEEWDEILDDSDLDIEEELRMDPDDFWYMDFGTKEYCYEVGNVHAFYNTYNDALTVSLNWYTGDIKIPFEEAKALVSQIAKDPQRYMVFGQLAEGGILCDLEEGKIWETDHWMKDDTISMLRRR